MKTVNGAVIHRPGGEKHQQHNRRNPTRAKFRSSLVILYIDIAGDAHISARELFADTPASRRYISKRMKTEAVELGYRSWRLIDLNASTLRGEAWHVVKGVDHGTP